MQDYTLNTGKFNFGSYISINDAEVRKGAQYAIYEFVTDRFIYASPDFKLLADLIGIFSSRYLLILVRLDTASNFKCNMIDNECVHNWTGTNLSLIKTSGQQYSIISLDADKLIPAESISNDELVIQDFDYINYTYNVLALLHWLETKHILPMTENKNILLNESIPYTNFYVDLIDNPIATQLGSAEDPVFVHIQKKKIYNILFTELDFKVAKPLVDALIKELIPGYTG